MAEGSTVQVEIHDEVAVVTMARGERGNALSPRLVEDLLEVLRRPDVVEERALVLAGDGGFFSSGLDLLELSDFGEARLLAFLDRLQGLLATVYVWSRPVVAAVNGHAVAGGCLLALCADWRICQRDDVRIGLNEIRLGLPLPQAGLEIARAELSPGAWAEVVYGGGLHGSEDAVRLGLAHEVCDSEELLSRAIDKARMWGQQSRVAFHRMKAGLRDRVLVKIRENHEAHQREWVNLWFSPAAQNRLEKASERLRSKA